LSEKLKPVSSDVIRIDFDSFSEPEKQLFRKIWEIEQEYGSSPSADVIEANKEFIFKAREIIGWRVIQLFMFVMKELLGHDEIEEWYFKLHFYNFFEDLKECLENVRRWTEKDREEFLCDMKQKEIDWRCLPHNPPFFFCRRTSARSWKGWTDCAYTKTHGLLWAIQKSGLHARYWPISLYYETPVNIEV